MGEKFGILRLLRIYHSTSRVEGLGFGLILINLRQAGSENHLVDLALCPFQVEISPKFCTFPTDPDPVHWLFMLSFMSRERGAAALQLVCSFLSEESTALGSSAGAGSRLYMLPC